MRYLTRTVCWVVAFLLFTWSVDSRALPGDKEGKDKKAKKKVVILRPDSKSWVGHDQLLKRMQDDSSVQKVVGNGGRHVGERTRSGGYKTTVGGRKDANTKVYDPSGTELVDAWLEKGEFDTVE